ncbi:MAG: GNAT family N-acetyltransferase [Clostridiales bacterium]|jgi:aminoglycoside 6'-N-acetyltransferase I|nr:GNAT family N-acetyltransferase [Clostridiales bacterium]
MIESYVHGDLDEYVDLFLDVFLNEPWHYHWMTREATARYFTDIENTPCFLGLVYRAEDGRGVTGVCLGVISDYFTPKVYDIKEIAVRRSEQGKGRGTRMLAEIEKFLSARGVTAVTLLTHRTIRAYNFYLRNGYQVDEDSVYMSKDI